MRLLYTDTFNFRQFFDERLPPYAILSHTWGDEEATFQELQEDATTALLKSTKNRWANEDAGHHDRTVKEGYLKIIGCALQAEKDGFEYIWCDTCCIDKTNSAELSEAINSMYSWYKDRLCYAYLADVITADHLTSCRWFTRGWTLQELIAPSSVVFYTRYWKVIGTRSNFKDIIAERTGIDKEVLDGEDPLLSSVAKRMSWASQRKTTRVEDIAYCLMGLFGVNMPLIYGEKHKAFLRLQTEIMKDSEDHSLFAWKTPSTLSEAKYCGLLARSPASFAGSRNISPLFSPATLEPPYSITSRGVSISLTLSIVYDLSQRYINVFFASLSCHDMTDARGPLGIFLVCTSENCYRRCYPDKVVPGAVLRGRTGHRELRHIYVTQAEAMPKTKAIPARQFYVDELPKELTQYGFTLHVVPNTPIATWDHEKRLIFSFGGLAASIYVGRIDGEGKVLHVGVDKKLCMQCVFDDASDTIVKSLNNLPSQRLDKGTQLAQTLLAYRSTGSRIPNSLLFRDKRQQWDEWVDHSSGNITACIRFNDKTNIERTDPKFYQKKTKEVWKKSEIKVYRFIEERTIEGRRVFVIRFSNQYAGSINYIKVTST
ncbi:MAG: hypothetical protein Q9209_005011 [Squamulea sp. 1 TL-2023]